MHRPPVVSGLVQRIDTFHPQWDLVRLALYHQGLLAVYKLDPPLTQTGQAEKNPFYVTNANTALTTAAQLQPPKMESETYLQPPECIIPLSECVLCPLTSPTSPIGRLLNQTKGLSGFEVIRYRDKAPLTYWVFSSEDSKVVDEWIDTLRSAMREISPSQDLYRDSSPFTPSTNPAVKPIEIGVKMPPSGGRWAAMHAGAATAATQSHQYRRTSEPF